MKRKIGVIGDGFVGSQVIRWFGGKPSVPWYSKTGGSFEAVDNCDIVFLCLPTPYDPQCGFELTALVENIKRLSPGKIIMIKSTVLPGTTKQFARQYPKQRFLFNPEFLRARTARQDFFNPDRQIIGVPDRRHKVTAGQVMDILPHAEFNIICDSNVAEMAKLVGNCYLAMRVVFANQMYDYCQQNKTDYKETIKIVKHDPRIGISHWDVNADGYRGYSGYCFPKEDRKSVV